MDDTVRQAIHRFQAYLQRRQYAAHTITNYTLDLQLFFAVCPRPPAHISFQDVERFIDQQYAQGLAPTTLHRRLHALKHFFDYLLEQRRVAGNPIKPSHMVRRGRPLPKTLSQDQVQQLFAQIHHPMDKALFLLMLRCGLRVSEVVHLMMDNIDWTQQAIRIVQGKGRKDRRVSISPDAATTLRICLTLRHTHGRYVCLLEAETPTATAFDYGRAKEDGAVCSSRGHEDQLSCAAPHIRLQFTGAWHRARHRQRILGPCLDCVQ
jgi:site-specific recombinase XerD